MSEPHRPLGVAGEQDPLGELCGRAQVGVLGLGQGRDFRLQTMQVPFPRPAAVGTS